MIPSPMLATPYGQLSRDRAGLMSTLEERGWYAEPKLDGVRGLVHVDHDGRVRLFNRRRRDIGFRWPELVTTMTLPPDTVVDGEIVVMEQGEADIPRVSYDLTHLRDAQENERDARLLAERHPGNLVVFDVLRLDGELVMHQSQRERWDVLAGLDIPYPKMTRTRAITDLWDAVVDAGGEGVVAKDPAAMYVCHRSKAWLKFKISRQISCFVTGWDAGQGFRSATFGALRLGLWDGASVVHVGRVGSGFNTRELELLTRLLAERDPLIVVDIRYREVTKGGDLREPVFLGVRTDLDLSACTTAQLAD
jgi:bifunctional non-homologous end joining protein LigD